MRRCRDQLWLFDPKLYERSFVMLYVFRWPWDADPEYAGLIKIGRSTHPHTRHDLEFPDTNVLAICPGTEDEEADIHARLFPWRMMHVPRDRSGYTEIYRPTPEVIAVVEDLIDRMQAWRADDVNPFGDADVV